MIPTDAEGKNRILMVDQGKEPTGDKSGREDDTPFANPVEIPIEDHLDLHPFQPKEIPGVVEEYLYQCKAAGFREVRLIHGKGKGVQRNIVRALLAKRAEIESYHDAPLENGSWGATVIILKN